MTKRATDIEFSSNGSDWGIVMKGKCPDCHEVVRGWSTDWDETEIMCSCGYEWKLVLEIVGKKQTAIG